MPVLSLSTNYTPENATTQRTLHSAEKILQNVNSLSFLLDGQYSVHSNYLALPFALRLKGPYQIDKVFTLYTLPWETPIYQLYYYHLLLILKDI